MGEIADAMVFSSSRLSYQIDKLGRAGLVWRERADADRRGNFACLTDVGMTALSAAADDHLALVQTLFVEAPRRRAGPTRHSEPTLRRRRCTVITVHRGAQRHHWNNEWLDSWQSFPATGNYDLAGTRTASLMVNNDDTIDPGEGLDRADVGRPDTSGLSPGYAEADITDLLVDGALVAAASGRPGVDAAVTLANRFATLHVARLTPGQRVTLPAAPFGHLYLPTGRMTVAGIDAELKPATHCD